MLLCFGKELFTPVKTNDPEDWETDNPFKTPATTEEIRRSINATFALQAPGNPVNAGSPLSPELYGLVPHPPKKGE